MSVSSNSVFNLRFNPTFYDSTLNSHSPTTDKACNIDNNLTNKCEYYDNENFKSNHPTKSDLSLFHLNCRSLNKNGTNITNYLESLDYNFDIYGFTETWFQSEGDANLVDLNDYSIENYNRTGRKGGGSSLFIHSSIQYSNRHDLGLNCTDCDSLFIEVVRDGQTNVIIGVIYKPETVIFDDFVSQLENTLNTVNKEKKTCYILGDFNLDLLKYDSKPKVNDFLNLLYSNNFSPCIDRPTRIKRNKHGHVTVSLIDNIFTNDIASKFNSGVFVTDLTDHFPIFTFTNNDSHRSTPPTASYINKRQLKSDNIKALKNALSMVDWNLISSNDPNPEPSYDKFHTKLTNLLNIHCPVIKTKVHKRKTPKKPWVTRGII